MADKLTASQRWDAQNPDRRREVNHKAYLRTRLARRGVLRRDRQLVIDQIDALLKALDGMADRMAAHHRRKLAKRASRKLDKLRRRASIRASGDRKPATRFIRTIQTAVIATCYWCNQEVEIGNRHIDHIIPIAKGGNDNVHNLCCACAACNMAKSDSLPHEFDGGQPLLL